MSGAVATGAELPSTEAPPADEQQLDQVAPVDAEARAKEAERASIRRYGKRFNQLLKKAKTRDEFKEQLREFADEIAPPEPSKEPAAQAPAMDAGASQLPPEVAALAESLSDPKKLAEVIWTSLNEGLFKGTRYELNQTKLDLLLPPSAATLEKWLPKIATGPEGQLLAVSIIVFGLPFAQSQREKAALRNRPPLVKAMEEAAQ